MDLTLWGLGRTKLTMIMMATNRPDIQHFPVLVVWIIRLKYDLPNEQARLDILKIHAASVNKGSDTSASLTRRYQVYHFSKIKSRILDYYY
jgi:ATP-dependent 26S proteasome regulatory subunit